MAHTCESLTIDLRAKSPHKPQSDWARIGNDTGLADVRTLTVLDNARANVSDDTLRDIANSLTRMPSLERLVYDGHRVPEGLLSASDGLPRCSVTLKLAILVDGPTRVAPVRVSGSNLYSLDIDLAFYEALHCFAAMRAIKDLIVRSPGLKILKLKVAFVSDSGQSQQYTGFGFQPGDNLPALQELELDRYLFGHQRGDEERGIVLNTKGYPGVGHEIDFWTKNFDWSSLKRLKTDDARFATALMPHLISLEAFFFVANDHRRPDLVSFFCEVPASLTSITIPTLRVASLKGLLRHSRTLQELKIHQPDTYRPRWSTEAAEIDFDCFRRISSRCQELRKLSRDVARAGEWPFDIFDQLAAFPALEELELWFELGAQDAENPVRPFLTTAAADHIFQYLVRETHSRRGQPRSSSTLQSLKLHCGHTVRYGVVDNRFIAPSVCWPLYNNASFLCERRTGGDGAAAEDQISVINLLAPPADVATHITASRSASSAGKTWSRLRSVLLRGRSTAAPDSHPQRGPGSFPHGMYHYAERAEVAEMGPRPLSQWEAHY